MAETLKKPDVVTWESVQQTADPVAGPPDRPLSDILWTHEGGGEFPYEERLKKVKQATGQEEPLKWYEIIQEMLPLSRANPEGNKRTSYGEITNEDLWFPVDITNPNGDVIGTQKRSYNLEDVFVVDPATNEIILDQNDEPLVQENFINYAELLKGEINKQTDLIASHQDKTGVVVAGGAVVGETEYKEGSVIDRYVDSRYGLRSLLKSMAADLDSVQWTDTAEIKGNEHLNNPLILQILNDEFPTGNFGVEIKERAMELGRSGFYIRQFLDTARITTQDFFTRWLPEGTELWMRGGVPREVWLKEQHMQHAQWLAETKRNFSEEFDKHWKSKDTYLNNWMHEKINERLQKLHTRDDGTVDQEAAHLYYKTHFMRMGRRKKGTKYVDEALIQKGSKVEEQMKAEKSGKFQPEDEYGNVLVPIQIFNQEEAEKLLNYALAELPFHKKLGTVVLESGAILTGTAPIGAWRTARAVDRLYGKIKYDSRGKAIINSATGLAEREIIKDADGKVTHGWRLIKDSKGKFKYPTTQYTDRQLHQHMLLEQSQNALTRAWVNLRFFPGKLIGSQGAAGRGTIALTQKSNLFGLHKQIDDINLQLRRKNLSHKQRAKLEKQKDELVVQATSLTFARPGSTLSYLGLDKIPRSPVMQETWKAELMLNFGQALGQEWIPRFYPGLSPQAGEGIGVLATLFKLHRLGTFIPRKVGAWVDHQAHNTFSRIPEEFGRMLENASWIPFISPGLWVNRNLDEISKAVYDVRGSHLSNRERGSIKLLANLTQHLEPEERKRMFEHIKEVNALKEKIVSYWPEQERGVINELYSSTFAQISTLVPLQAMEGIGSGVRFRDIAGFNFRKLNSIISQSEQTYHQAMMGVIRMQKSALTSVPSHKIGDVNRLFDQQKARLDEYMSVIDERKGHYEKALAIYKNYITGKTGIMDEFELTDNILTDLYDLEGTLRRVSVGEKTIPEFEVNKSSVLQKQKEDRDTLNTFVADLQNDLYTALDNLGSTSTDPNIITQRQKIMERIFEVEMWRKKAAIKNKWQPIDELLGNQKQDISPFIESFITRIAKSDEQGKIHMLFSEEGRFFHGYLGKRLHTALKSTIGKTMASVVDDEGKPVFTPENIKMLQDFAMKDESLALAKPPDITQLFFMLKNGDMKDLEVANSSLAGVSDILKMEVGFGDLMDVQNALEQFAYAMTQKTSGKARLQGEIAADLAQELLGLVETPKITSTNRIDATSAKEMIQEAKDFTQATNFDVTARKNTLTNKILSNRTTKRKMPVETDINSTDPSFQSTMFGYGKGASPLQYIENFAEEMLQWSATGKGDPIAKLKELISMFGRKSEEFPEEGLVFNLDDPVSKNDFRLLQKVLEGVVYNKWDTFRYSVLKDLPDASTFELSDFDLVKTLKPIDSETIERMEKMQKVLDQVKVVHTGPDGNKILQRGRFLDLKGLIAIDRSLSKILAASPDARKIANKIEADYNVMDTILKAKLNDRISGDKVKSAALEVIKQGQTSEQFMTKMLSMTPSQLEAFKRDMMQGSVTTLGDKEIGVTKKGTKPIELPSSMTEEEFNATLAHEILSGLFAVGEYGPTGTMMWQNGNGGTKYVNAEGFTDVGLSRMFKMLNVKSLNPKDAAVAEQNIEKLKLLMGEDTTEVLTTFAEFFVYNQLEATGLAKIRVTGLMRDISPNELISRAFNLARGMVGPTYLMAELYLRLAGSHGIEIMDLAVQNKQAGDLIIKMMKAPKQFSETEAKNLNILLQEFVFTELLRAGVTEIDYGSEEQLRDLYYDIYRKENQFASQFEQFGSNFEIFGSIWGEGPHAGVTEEKGGFNPQTIKDLLGESQQKFKYRQQEIEELRRAEGARV